MHGADQGGRLGGGAGGASGSVWDGAASWFDGGAACAGGDRDVVGVSQVDEAQVRRELDAMADVLAAERRGRGGLSQMRLAELFGVSVNSVATWELRGWALMRRFRW